MQYIKVKKAALLEILNKNKAEHRDAFVQAQKAYRETVIRVLDEELASVRHGSPFVVARITALVQPGDHTSDYERVIGMLQLDVEETVQLNQQEYSCYVDDNWGWMRQFANEVSSYGVSNAKLANFTGE